jgi:hypothetical protein
VPRARLLTPALAQTVCSRDTLGHFILIINTGYPVSIYIDKNYPEFYDGLLKMHIMTNEVLQPP